MRRAVVVRPRRVVDDGGKLLAVALRASHDGDRRVRRQRLLINVVQAEKNRGGRQGRKEGRGNGG